MYLCSMRRHQLKNGTYAEAERLLRLRLENGNTLPAYVAVQVDAKDAEGVLMGERLMEWLRQSEATGEASIEALASVAEGTPYQLRVWYPRDATYPFIYFFDGKGRITHGVHVEAPEWIFGPIP